VCVPNNHASLGDGWKTVHLFTWSSVFACLVTLTVSSRTIGRPIWWIGPQSDPASPVLLLIPIALVVVPVLTAYRVPQRAGVATIGAALGVMACGLVAISSTPAIAIAVMVVGFAALMASIACLAGSRKYR